MTRISPALGVVALAMIATGCGSRCQEVARARDALVNRAAARDRGPDVEVRVPFDRANTLIAELLQAEPLTVPIDVPDLGPIEITVGALTATAREVQVRQGSAGKIRFATQLDIRDGDEPVTTLAVVAEVAPVLERKDGGAELVIGFGPENLVAVSPELGPDAPKALNGTVTRWASAKLRDRIPKPVLELGAKRLATHLKGAAYKGLQKTLFKRIGEVTRLRLRLPDVPVGNVTITSTARALVVDIATELPVRRGLMPAPESDADVSVRISGSAVAELANWAIERSYLPRWYNRSLEPRTTGEFRPRFDYIADTTHPIKIYAFQERGGCSYFRVGVRASVAMAGEQVKATALDRDLERKAASPVIEWLAWMKYFLAGWIDRSKQVAMHTRLAGRGRALETRVIGATLANDELRFTLQLTGESTTPP